MRFEMTDKRGFTLIELLVVISIIALLSSIVLASLNDARLKTKKSAFAQGLYEFQKALELYRADNGIYPYEGSNASLYINNGTGKKGVSSFVDTMTSALTTIPGASVGLIPNYIKSLPIPITDGTNSINQGKITLQYDAGPSLTSGSQDYTCGGKPVQGYLLTLTDYYSPGGYGSGTGVAYYPLPKKYLYGNWSGSDFCLTGL